MNEFFAGLFEGLWQSAMESRLVRWGLAIALVVVAVMYDALERAEGWMAIGLAALIVIFGELFLPNDSD